MCVYERERALPWPSISQEVSICIITSPLPRHTKALCCCPRAFSPLHSASTWSRPESPLPFPLPSTPLRGQMNHAAHLSAAPGCSRSVTASVWTEGGGSGHVKRHCQKTFKTIETNWTKVEECKLSLGIGAVSVFASSSLSSPGFGTTWAPSYLCQRCQTLMRSLQLRSASSEAPLARDERCVANTAVNIRLGRMLLSLSCFVNRWRCNCTLDKCRCLRPLFPQPLWRVEI